MIRHCSSSSSGSNGNSYAFAYKYSYARFSFTNSTARFRWKSLNWMRRRNEWTRACTKPTSALFTGGLPVMENAAKKNRNIKRIAPSWMMNRILISRFLLLSDENVYWIRFQCVCVFVCVLNVSLIGLGMFEIGSHELSVKRKTEREVWKLRQFKW